jgi:putative ABC transport system permease protein
LSILFIVMVSIGYKQYRYSIAFDLGFETENILTIDLQQNKPAPLIKELSELPEIKQIANAHNVSSVGANNFGNVKYKDATDSTIIHYNFIDQEYISLHEHKLIAGENFKPVISEDTNQSEVIVNQRTVKWMQLSDPHQALGEELIIDGQKSKVIGVVEDFHYERVNYPIQNFAFRYDPRRFKILSLKIESTDMKATMDKIQAIWKKIDPIHPLQAKFYQDHIHDAYEKLSWIMKIVGFIAFLAISIASMGLFAMVIFTTETRLKEISIRKVLGASEGRLVFLMSRGFIVLLIVSSAIAIPAAYYFMDQIIFGKIVYRVPIGVMDLFMGTMAVMGIAFLLIGSQTLNVARANPAAVLKNE